eukprot:scaffold495873_cov55-Attheya_sp.AAC.1
MWRTLRVGLVLVFILATTTRTYAFVSWSVSSQQPLRSNQDDLRIGSSSIRRWTTRRVTHYGTKKGRSVSLVLGASKRSVSSSKRHKHNHNRSVPRYVRLEQRTTPRTRRTVVELQTAVQRFVK